MRTDGEKPWKKKNGSRERATLRGYTGRTLAVSDQGIVF
jgi:hypothetical protein